MKKSFKIHLPGSIFVLFAAILSVSFMHEASASIESLNPGEPRIRDDSNIHLEYLKFECQLNSAFTKCLILGTKSGGGVIWKNDAGNVAWLNVGNSENFTVLYRQCGKWGARGEELCTDPPLERKITSSIQKIRTVGIVPDGANCGKYSLSGTDIQNRTISTYRVYLDGEDNSSRTYAYGWDGKWASSGSNSNMYFCPADGTKLNAKDFAIGVLKLANSCPTGSKTYTVYIDSEDNRPNSSMSSGMYPNKLEGRKNIKLHFCVFAPEAGGQSFPNYQISYGVFSELASGYDDPTKHGTCNWKACYGVAYLPRDYTTGLFYLNTEKSNNANKAWADDSTTLYWGSKMLPKGEKNRWQHFSLWKVR